MASFYLAADALIKRDGKYLMIEEGKEYVEGTWNVPGGGIEHGENPLEALKREVFEETGLSIKEVEGLIGVFNSRSAEDGHPVVVLIFSCRVEDGDPEPEFDEEIIDAEFLRKEELEDKELRNDIVLRAIENRSHGKILPPESFSSYMHPYMDGEPEV